MVKLQTGWDTSFSKKERFGIGAVLYFLAYYLFMLLKKLKPGDYDYIYHHLFQPLSLIAIAIGIVFGLIAFWFSLMAAAVIASLIPTNKEK